MDPSPKIHDHVFNFSSEVQTPSNDTCKILLNNILFNDRIVEHIYWFCRFRWIVIGVLLLFGISSYFDNIFSYMGLNPDLCWPFSIAGIAIIINILFKIHADRLQPSGPASSLLINMWTQIILDLVILTIVIHYVGSLDTVISFAYLFHIVISCIFFSRSQSLLVITFSSLLFITCVVSELTGILPPCSIYRNIFIRNETANPQAIIIHIITILTIWYVVWYLVSYISNLVRERDYELCTTNQRLKEAQEEKTKHLLRLTHELKAPFAAIDANIQVIQKGHCGVLPFKALELLERIAARSRKLGDVIQAMLQLENVQKMTTEMLNTESLDLAEVIKWCLAQVQATAEKQNVKIEANLQSVQVNANEDCMKMLFSNVISNAILYSHQNDHVTVVCRPRADSGPIAYVEDHGIGIFPEKIDKIFDEYYRTDEAVAHNKNSNGLGLAIVKHVAQIHRLTIRVASAPNVGTRFEIFFPNSMSPSAINK
jgi:two-component system, OmpR family, phosphate regulon sensor histidine kinase PhoR